MTIGPASRILAASLLLCAILVGLVLRENHARATGREVAVPMAAVDPRNLLTGHYVALNLAQPLAPGATCPPPGERPSRDGWVGLRSADGRFLRSGERREAVLQAGADVAVKGQAVCFANGFGGARGSVTLRIGVDRFHAAQTEAEAIERRLRGRDPIEGAIRDFAVISVGGDGRARLKGLMIDGRRSDLDWW